MAPTNGGSATFHQLSPWESTFTHSGLTPPPPPTPLTLHLNAPLSPSSFWDSNDISLALIELQLSVFQFLLLVIDKKDTGIKNKGLHLFSSLHRPHCLISASHLPFIYSSSHSIFFSLHLLLQFSMLYLATLFWTQFSTVRIRLAFWACSLVLCIHRVSLSVSNIPLTLRASQWRAVPKAIELTERVSERVKRCRVTG